MPRVKRDYPFRNTTMAITPEMDANASEIISRTKKRGDYTVNNMTEAVRFALDFTAKKLMLHDRVEVRCE